MISQNMLKGKERNALKTSNYEILNVLNEANSFQYVIAAVPTDWCYT